MSWMGLGCFGIFFAVYSKRGFCLAHFFPLPLDLNLHLDFCFFTSKKISYLFFSRAALEALSRLVGRGFYPLRIRELFREHMRNKRKNWKLHPCEFCDSGAFQEH